MKQRSGWDLEDWRRAAQCGGKKADSPIRPILDSLRKIHAIGYELRLYRHHQAWRLKRTGGTFYRHLLRFEGH